MRYLPYKLVKSKILHSQAAKIEALQSQITAAQRFIKEIESGNLSIEFDTALAGEEADNLLGGSLQSMRDQMHKIAETEKKRNWTTEGLAKFIEILRSKNDDVKALGETIISHIVKYMNANQGSLYILNDDDKNDICLELIGCYAYDRKKFLTHKVALGSGLLGQAVLEKGIVYMKNLPNDYLKITSGLGGALPKNLMIVPLLMNEKVYGAIELASFQTFEDHHREFIQKLAESIASTVSSVRINHQTRKLLEDTQAQAEQMRSQEEEMRQNMEELTATQEEMQRVLEDVQGKEEYLNELINGSADSIFTVDRSLKLLSWNKVFERTQQAGGISIFKGFELLSALSESERAANAALYRRAFTGESFELRQELTIQGKKLSFMINYSPLRAKGEIFAVGVFAKDISDIINAQRKAEQLMSEAQHQTEELKAQEEELRQNMEELSATQDEMQRILKEVESREKYTSALLNVSTDSIFTLDRDYKLVSWNDTFAKTLTKFGIKLEKGLDTLGWYQGEEQIKQKKLYDRVLAGESFDTTSASRQENEEVHFLSIHAPLRNEMGEVFEAAIFAKDVTEMIKAQQDTEKLTDEIRAKEAYLNAVLNAAGDSIFTIDKEFKLLSWNKSFEDGLSQMNIKLVKGFNILDIFPDAKTKEAQSQFYTRAFTGEVFNVTNEFNYNGMVTHYSSSFSPLRDAEKQIFAVSIFGKDVTELVGAKLKAEALAKEAREKTEEVRAQEEELRQNLEELSTSQEEMHRIMKTVEAKEAYASALLDASDDMIFTIDHDYRLVSWNKTFAASLEQYGVELQKGMNTLDWYPDSKQRKEQKVLHDRVLKGESVEGTTTSDINGKSHQFRTIHKPLKNEKGKVYEAVIFSRDISEVKGK
jgi:PAS domain S-box-containing protein